MEESAKKEHRICAFYESHRTVILELIKFVLVGGVNTLIGGILLPQLFQILTGEQSFILFDFFVIDMPIIYGFLVWFTAAYYLQIRFVFRCKWDWRRFCIYPLTQIPNIAINQILLYLFKDVLKITVWDNLIARALAAGCALPIMFVLVRLVVKPLKRKGKKETDDGESPVGSE